MRPAVASDDLRSPWTRVIRCFAGCSASGTLRIVGTDAVDLNIATLNTHDGSGAFRILRAGPQAEAVADTTLTEVGQVMSMDY